MCDALELRGAENGLPDTLNLGIDVALYAQAACHFAQGRTCIDENARRSLVRVRNEEDTDPGQHANHPGDPQGNPTEAPGSAQLVEYVFEYRLGLQVHDSP